MQRINSPATNNLFVDDNPSTGTVGTAVMAAWLNSVQEELCGLVETAGIELNTVGSDSYGQLLAAINGLCGSPGFLDRPVFAYAGVDSITIGPGIYQHVGTTSRRVSWDSTITFVFGSAGSNSDSVDLAADTWFYVYLDDSTIEADKAFTLDASHFVANTTSPTYSGAKRGYYNGNDRFIFAVRTNSSSEILEFYHDGGNFVQYANELTVCASTNFTDTFQTLDLPVPAVENIKANIIIRHEYISSTYFYLTYRPYGSSESIGSKLSYVVSTDIQSFSIKDVFTGVHSGIPAIDVRSSQSTPASTGEIWAGGWFFPQGV